MVRVTLKRPEVAEGLRLQAADAQAFVAKEVACCTQVVRDEKISAQN